MSHCFESLKAGGQTACKTPSTQFMRLLQQGDLKQHGPHERISHGIVTLLNK
uniref:Uncharacterized protein n=1 Tax=Physcomitrium patens TaxID=3218 RepID=A0A2K1JY12_PHYPA|nr:hypothetical protein PHYPA_013537 [Physcomitrium patens]